METFVVTCLFLAASEGQVSELLELPHHAESLKIDAHYAREIQFDPIDVRIAIPGKEAYLRIDPPVEDVEAYQDMLFREIGVRPESIRLTNPAQKGRQVHLRFRDGKECSFIWVRKDRDPRLTQASREHEKYHALMRLAPEQAGKLSEAMSALGFPVRPVDHDEELAATIVEVLSLHALGVRLEDISGSEIVNRSKAILIAARTGAGGGRPKAPAPDMNIAVEWPQEKETLEIPIEWLDDLPVVRCAINGKPAALLLDTGAQGSALYRDRLERLGVGLVGESTWKAYGTGGAYDAEVCGKHEIVFEGGLRMKVSAALVMRPGNWAYDLDGILGVKVMKALHGVLDLGRARLILKLKE